MLFFAITSITYLSGCVEGVRSEGLGDKTIAVGETFDPMDGVKVVVTRDGTDRQDITSYVSVEFNSVNSNRPGVYTLIYTHPVRRFVNDVDVPTSISRQRTITVLPIEPQIISLSNQRILLGT